MTARGLALAVVVGAFALTATSSAAPSASGTIFRVRTDLRMCPSPLCGGFWVGRVNRTTTCADGTARAWCHVLQARLPGWPTSRRDETILARGSIATIGASPGGAVERFVATKVWLPATRAPATGVVYLVTDTGIRCVRAPCFSLRTATVNTVRTSAASGLDLAPVRAPSLSGKAQLALTREGLLVAGTIRREADGGSTVVATQFFLAAS